MENKLVMISDVVKEMMDVIKKYGDLPVFIADIDSDNAMVPVIDATVIQISKPGIKPENAFLIANFSFNTFNNEEKENN